MTFEQNLRLVVAAFNIVQSSAASGPYPQCDYDYFHADPPPVQTDRGVAKSP